jgi:catechol 2,3-dioxygenase
VERIHPGVTIGHVHLTVSDIARSERWYREVLGMEVAYRYKTGAVFLSAGGYHHHIALNLRAGPGAPPPPPGTTGLYHYCLLYPTRRELARAVKRAIDHGIDLRDYDDYEVSQSVYFPDPDGIWIELSWDTSRELWRHTPDGLLEIPSTRKPIAWLLRELETA